MKIITYVSVLALFFLTSNALQAQHNHGSHDHNTGKEKKAIPANSLTEIFVVYGNCNMCKKRIESSLVALEGVHEAKWDVDTKVMTLKYDDNKVALDDVKKKIAISGHDTDKYKATDESYEDLPGCCQYDRPKN